MSNTVPETRVAEEYDRLRGRLCGLVESWGLDNKRERAMIATLKTLTYESQKVIDEIVTGRSA